MTSFFDRLELDPSYEVLTRGENEKYKQLCSKSIRTLDEAKELHQLSTKCGHRGLTAEATKSNLSTEEYEAMGFRTIYPITFSNIMDLYRRLKNGTATSQLVTNIYAALLQFYTGAEMTFNSSNVDKETLEYKKSYEKLFTSELRDLSWFQWEEDKLPLMLIQPFYSENGVEGPKYKELIDTPSSLEGEEFDAWSRRLHLSDRDILNIQSMEPKDFAASVLSFCLILIKLICRDNNAWSKKSSSVALLTSMIVRDMKPANLNIEFSESSIRELRTMLSNDPLREHFGKSLIETYIYPHHQSVIRTALNWSIMISAKFTSMGIVRLIVNLAGRLKGDVHGIIEGAIDTESMKEYISFQLLLEKSISEKFKKIDQERLIMSGIVRDNLFVDMKLSNHPRFTSFIAGCFGALDGTHPPEYTSFKTYSQDYLEKADLFIRNKTFGPEKAGAAIEGMSRIILPTSAQVNADLNQIDFSES